MHNNGVCGFGMLSMYCIVNNSVVFNYSGVCLLFLILLYPKILSFSLLVMASRDRLIADQWALRLSITLATCY